LLLERGAAKLCPFRNELKKRRQKVLKTFVVVFCAFSYKHTKSGGRGTGWEGGSFHILFLFLKAGANIKC
jgi:hypothetical protein